MDKNLAIRDFIAKLAADEKLNNEFQEILREGSKDKAYEFAVAHSESEFSKEEFENYIALITKEYQEELTESSLDQVSGGGDDDKKKGTGHLSMANEMWKHVTNFEQTKNDIYAKEGELQDEKNKTTIIGAGIDAAGTFVNMMKNFGNLYFSGQDLKDQERDWNDKKEARELHNLQRKLEIEIIKRKLRT